MTMTRRQALAAGAALPAAALATSARPAGAQTAAPGAAAPIARTFQLGAFRVTPLLAGTSPREDPHSIFGLNVPDEEFAEVSAEAFLPTDMAQFFFTPTLVDTGSEVILFDTGIDAGGTTTALEAAGYGADDVTHVVLTHMHGDHIGGLTGEDGSATFANAAYVTGQAEFDHWAAAGNEGFEAKVRPFAEQMTMLSPGDAVRGGITAVDAAGHSPGHMAYRIESDGSQLMLIGDLANHPVYSLARPDWEVRFDMDKEMAAAARRRVLSELAADRIPMIGYHMPFPALGFVAGEGSGFRYIPYSYQTL